MILPMKCLIFAPTIAVSMLGSASAQQDSLSQKSITGPPEPARPKPNIKPPRAIKTPEPEPARHPGKDITEVSITVGTDGRVHDGKVIQSSGSTETDNNAVAAILKWRFEPATVDGHPVAIKVNIKVDARRQ
jgi:TonB family protein